MQDWTAKVDTKASIVMALETGLSSIILAFSDSVRFPNHPDGALFWAHRSGLVLLFVSIVLAGAVVFPQIRHRSSARSWQDNYLYFGHIRHWQPTELAAELLSGRTRRHLHALSTQLVVMSRVVWRKHVALQCSMLCALLGCIAIGVTLIPK
ncbi:MAG: Pycsar system effector family protein [Pseudonocardiaceae bacterium]